MGRGEKAAHRLTAERLFAQNWSRKEARALLNAKYPEVASTELAKALRQGGFGNKYYRGGQVAAFFPTRNTAGGEDLDASAAADDNRSASSDSSSSSSSGPSSHGSKSAARESASVAATTTTMCSAAEQPKPQHTPPLPRLSR